MTFLGKSIVLLMLMLVSASFAVAMRLTISIADELPPIDLNAMVPTTFGNWQKQLDLSNQIVNPEEKQQLEEIYSETLSRTYINPNGYVIMLSIAYGKNQKGKMQLHRPEVCYPAQGFTVSSSKPGKLDLPGQPIAVARLETSLGQRLEPVTYWTVVGEYVTANQNEKRLAEVRYAMRGRIPDGMLVRVSSIDKDVANAQAIQSQFAVELVQAIAPEHRDRFVGKPQSN